MDTREISRPREETAGEAIRRIDALCPWLVGAARCEIRRRACGREHLAARSMRTGQ
jgi:hypothetical protein